MTYRVIQWATGTVGIHAVPAIHQHPDLELAGLWVHSDEKAGRDAGEICGIDPIGVTATQDAAILSLMSYRGQFEYGVVEGPFAFDNAVSTEAAAVKGIKNPVAGQADVLLVPDIEAGNILVKSFVYLANGRVSGVLVGAAAPVVLTSRTDTAEAKFFSIATAVYMAQIEETHVKIGRRL